jgi:anti-sigma factor RsiW
MTNCRKFRRALNYSSQLSDADREGLSMHTANCEACRKAAAIGSLTSALIKAHASEIEAQEVNPYLMARIRARIRELGGMAGGVGSWESAVLSLRGWLLAFGAAALILLSISVQWRLSDVVPDQDNDVTSLSNIGEEFISGNLGKPAGALPLKNEAIRDAHK